MNSTDGFGDKPKTQEDIRFETKLEREMRLADKRVKML